MRKAIIIILIVIVVAAIILSGIWLLSRRTAQKNGSNPQTFREFVTGENKNDSSSQNPDDISSEFTTPDSEGPTSNEGTSNTTQETTGSPIETRSSTFTNSNVSPADVGTSSSSGTTPNTPGSPYTGTGGVLPDSEFDDIGAVIPEAPITVTDSTTASVPDCSDASLNITFTPQELVELKALQNRFYAVADTLYTDANVATEEANRTSFALKTAQIKDLYTYCTTYQTAVGNTNPYFKYRTPTPFWYDPANPNGGPSNTFTGYLNPTLTNYPGNVLFGGGVGVSNFGPGQGGIEFTKKKLEGALRLNLW